MGMSSKVGSTGIEFGNEMCERTTHLQTLISVSHTVELKIQTVITAVEVSRA